MFSVWFISEAKTTLAMSTEGLPTVKDISSPVEKVNSAPKVYSIILYITFVFNL